MRLQIGGNPVRLSERLRSHVERRVFFCLSRFGDVVESVRVRLSDVNGPRRGIDRVCRVLATVRGSGVIVVEDRDRSYTQAVNSALQRTARHVARAAGRMRGRPGERGRERRRSWARTRALAAGRSPDSLPIH
jgi:putative sigma-54 modulation protein